MLFRSQATITLTTTGTSGAATFSSNTLNIPQYQAALTNPVTGTGTLNYVSKFSATGSTIANSQIFDNASNVVVNGTNSSSGLFGERFAVIGSSRVYHNYAHALGIFTSGFAAAADVTTAAGSSYTAGMFYGASSANYTNAYAGSVTIPNNVIVSSTYSLTSVGFSGTGTITVSQGSLSVRAINAHTYQLAISSGAAASSVLTHAAGLQILAPYYASTNTPTITNWYGIALNDSSEYSANLAITNRWGIYQQGSSDTNYFAGTVLIGNTSSTGEKLQVTGTAKFTGALSGTSATFSSLTSGYILKASTSGLIANSSIYDNGTGRVSIGTSNTYNSFVISNNATTGWEFGNDGSVITYNRSTSAYIPMTLQASSFSFTGAATFSSRINGVVGGTLYNTAGLWLQGSTSTDGIAIGGTSGGDKNIDTYGGTLKINATAGNGLSVTGAATFSSSLTTWGDITVNSSNAVLTLNNTQINGTNRKIQVWNNVSAYIDVLAFAATGAATFSSSVTTTGTIFGNAGFNNTVLSSSDATNIANGFNLLGSSSYWGMRTLTGGHFSLDVYNAGSPKSAFYISNTGNVGIGTSSPTTFASNYTALNINANTGYGSGVIFKINNTTETNFYAETGLTTLNLAGAFTVTQAGGTRFYIDTNANGGKVGIGKSPSDKLDVSGIIRTSNTTDPNYYGTLSNPDGLTHLGTYGGGSLVFDVSGTERMRITSGGNVLINGTVVQNSATNRGNLTINGTTSILNLSTSDTNAGYLYHGGTDMLLVNSKNGATLFYTNDTERMRITSGGVVLVANSSGTQPTIVGSERMNINGTIYATGFFESSSVVNKNILETNPLSALNIDVIKYIRKNDDTNDIRYGYSAEQIHSLMPELTDSKASAVKYLDVHTLLIAQLQKRISELESKLAN